MNSLYCIAEGKMYILGKGDFEEKEIGSNIFESYISRKKRFAQQKEWKTQGNAAVFAGNYKAGSDAESEVRNTKMNINCLRVNGRGMIYSMTIDETSGIYTKSDIYDTETQEGFVISDANDRYGAFDIRDGNIAVAVEYAGESHIGVIENGTNECRLLTEGFTREENPVWDNRGRKIICQSCGLAEEERGRSSMPPMLDGIDLPANFMDNYVPYIKGPYSLVEINTVNGEVDYILSDDKYNFIKPSFSSDGYLYFIRYPYNDDKNSTSFKDNISAPVRFFKGVAGWMNLFTLIYSGKPMIKKNGAKTPDAKKMYIDGNIIEAEKELEENRKNDEKYPGIIPSSFELCRMRAGEEISVVKKGVIAYALDRKSGDIYYSNGNGVIKLSPDGNREKVLSRKKVTFIGVN